MAPHQWISDGGRGNDLLVFLAAFACQWAIGAIINLWETGMANSYAPVVYQAGFGMMVVLQLLGLAWFFMAPVIRHTQAHER